MPRLYLVRHGRPVASFVDSSDPGLDAVGAAQAEAVAERLAAVGPLAIVVSPLRRTRETARPLEQRWRRPAEVEPAVGEIPSPGLTVSERGDWLRALLDRRWPDVADDVQAWRASVLSALAAVREASVVVSHYVAINIAVGRATADDRVRCFSPGHCSVTVIDVDGDAWRVIERGEEGITPVL
jgi:broad specificity phosphatase PhoE